MDYTGSIEPYIISAKYNIRSIGKQIIVSKMSDTPLGLVEYSDHSPQISMKQ